MSNDQSPSFVVGAGAAFIPLSVIFVGLRFYTRTIQRVGYGADDWLALVALVFVVGLCTCLIAGVEMQAFAYPTTPTSGVLTQKFEFAFQPIQILAVGFTKLSFVFFFRRIFVSGRSNGIFNITTIVVICIISLWMAAFFLQYIFQCGSNFSAAWGPHSVAVKECLVGIKAEQAVAISDFLTDLIVLTLPIPMVLRLHMTGSRKIAVLVVFGLGIVALAASIIRMVIYINATKIAFQEHVDNDLLITRGLYWATIESGLAIIACCLPTMSALGRTRTLESAIRSVRSRVSIKSGSSSKASSAVGGSGSKGDVTEYEMQRRSSSMRSSRRGSTKNFTDIEATGGEHPPLPDNAAAATAAARGGENGEIWVDSKIEQKTEAA